jgi:hypothetical protein
VNLIQIQQIRVRKEKVEAMAKVAIKDKKDKMEKSDLPRKETRELELLQELLQIGEE